MKRQSKNFARTTGFTLVELMIVVVILGILAAITMPAFSNYSQETREKTLKEDLRFLRNQIAVFSAQHRDVPPGFAGGNPASSPTEADFVAQMTQLTDDHSTIGGGNIGPYLSQMPANPVNGLSTIMIIGGLGPMPQADGSTGWIYKPATLEIQANLTGTDTTGESFGSY